MGIENIPRIRTGIMVNNNLNAGTLIFVYNADSELFSLVSDFAHKILSPETYACNLCKLTYGNFFIKKDWKDFIENLRIEKLFYHKDQFCQKYPDFAGLKLPAILVLRNGAISEIIGAEELNRLTNLNALQNILLQRLAL